MTDPTADAGTEPETGSEESPEPFENRAARRAKGKATAANQVQGSSQRVGRSGTVQSPRQYGNRRSG